MKQPNEVWAEIQRAYRHYMIWQFGSVPILIAIMIATIAISEPNWVEPVVPIVMLVLFVVWVVGIIKVTAALAWVECPICHRTFHGFVRTFIIPFGLYARHCRSCGAKIGSESLSKSSGDAPA